MKDIWMKQVDVRQNRCRYPDGAQSTKSEWCYHFTHGDKKHIVRVVVHVDGAYESQCWAKSSLLTEDGWATLVTGSQREIYQLTNRTEAVYNRYADELAKRAAKVLGVGP